MPRAPMVRSRGVVLGLAAIVVGGVVVAAAVLTSAVPGLRGTTNATVPPAGTAASPAVPRFVDEASSAGIGQRYDGDFLHFVGGGVAVLDCNADGRPDLYFAGGSEPAALYRNNSTDGGALRFARVASAVTDLKAVTGAYPIDVDSDGIADLAVLRVGGNVLLRGRGACRFERANEAWGFDGGNQWTTAFSATWESGARWPTVAFGNYLALDTKAKPTQDCADNELLRPDASGNRFGRPTRLHPAWCTLSVLFSDWSRSGRRDLRISNDRHYYSDYSEGEDQLWRVDPGQAPRTWTRAEGWQTVRVFGMGIASEDLTGDGYPEIYLTSQADNKLQTLAAGANAPTYRDIALRLGLTAHKPYAGGDIRPSTAWHPEFDDVNNDGYIDLFVTKGNVEAMNEYADRDPSDLLLQRADGTFVEAAPEAGIVKYARSRGAAVTDLNMDGLLDMVVVNRRANVSVWRNVGTGDATRAAQMGHWVAMRLRQPEANRDAIGAWIEVRAGGRTTTRELTIGGGHAGGELGWIHFGLGAAASAEVRVTWPDGTAGQWMRVPADGFFTIERDAPQPSAWRPEGS